MIVEFIGTPGAGKSTLLPTVIEILQNEGGKALTHVAASRLYAQRTFPGKAICRLLPGPLHRSLLWQVFYRLSILYRLRFLIKHLRLCWQVLRSQSLRPASADIKQRKVLSWFFRVAGYYEFLRAYAQPNEALIFDEGFIHRVVQLHVSGMEEPDPSQIVTYVDLLPKPDVVIYVQAQPEVCEQRIYGRGLWERFRHKPPQEISRFVANAHQVVILAVEHIKQKGWLVIEVDNSSDNLVASKMQLRDELTDKILFGHGDIGRQTVS